MCMSVFILVTVLQSLWSVTHISMWILFHVVMQWVYQNIYRLLLFESTLYLSKCILLLPARAGRQFLVFHKNLLFPKSPPFEAYHPEQHKEAQLIILTRLSQCPPLRQPTPTGPFWDLTCPATILMNKILRQKTKQKTKQKKQMKRNNEKNAFN